MALVLAPPAFIHPDRYGVHKTMGPNRLFVIHTSEGAEGENSAEALVNFMGSKGDRLQSDGTYYGSSYQYTLDTDRVIPCVPENVVAYAASGANNDGIHVCFPGTVRQTREQWLDPISSAYIDRCAELLVTRSAVTGIPLARITPAQVVAGAWGLCDHYTITLAYKKTDHNDVGPNFPWDVLFQRIKDLQNPAISQEDLPMECVIKGQDAAHHPVLVVVDGAGTHMTGLTSDIDVSAMCAVVGQGTPRAVSNALWEDLLVKALASMPQRPVSSTGQTSMPHSVS